MTFLFGYRSGSLAELAKALALELGVAPVLRDSSFRGGDYWLFEAGEESAILQANNDGGPPEEPAEQAFAEWRVLLYVEAPNEMAMVARLRASSTRPVFLRAPAL